MNENEIKAKQFLEYVENNIELLKRNLKKNITYNDEIFEDSFNDTVLKIHNSILKNGTEIKDYKQYFFMSSKWQYINADNKNKRKKELEIRGLLEDDTFEVYEEEIDEMERENKTFNALQSISDLITLNFTPLHSEIYLKYMMGKVNKKKKTSYDKIAEEYNINLKDVTNIITSVKKFLNDNEELNKIKNRYKE